MSERERLSRRGLRAPCVGALLALAGASGCAPVFDYPLGDLNPPAADAASDTSVESGDGAVEAQADASVDSSGDADAGQDADASLDADAGSPDTLADVTGEDATNDVVADVATDADSGSSGPGIGTLGAACSTTGDLACAGHAVKQQLVCGADLHWQGNGACSSGQLCDSRPGANQGTCATIDALCATHLPNETICNGQARVQCGPDLVSSIVIESCVNQACTPAACVGVCVTGQARCFGGLPQACDANGAWAGGAACGSDSVCASGICLRAPSCVGGQPGQNDCGPTGNEESCCTSPLVSGGTFIRSYDGVGYTDASYHATVSTFRLDAYEVTVGRFRRFVAAVVSGWKPAAGAGKHTHLNGGSGLNASGGGFELGWDVAWNASLPADKATWDDTTNLACQTGYQTWTSVAGANETFPIDCVSWYQAAAFCIWDGGFLPSEAEWNYAAAGGAEQRAYPWGPTTPGADANLAVYGCYFNGSGSCTGLTNLAPVGSVTAGNGKWGHADLAGNVWEWALDWYASPYAEAQCTDCARLAPSSARVLRGGDFGAIASSVLTSRRLDLTPATQWYYGLGARCARSP